MLLLTTHSYILTHHSLTHSLGQKPEGKKIKKTTNLVVRMPIEAEHGGLVLLDDLADKPVIRGRVITNRNHTRAGSTGKFLA